MTRSPMAKVEEGGAEFDAAKAVIAEANNSLYGSQSYFLSANGGEPDKYHLARPIERMKARANRLWRTNGILLDALERLLEVHEAMGAGQSPAARHARTAIGNARSADLSSEGEAAS